MELITIACNNCGAPLRVPHSANYVTCNHCGSQLAVKRNENVTYTEKIKEIDERTKQIDERTEDMQEELGRLRIDNELARIERDWEREKESYMITDKHGHKRIPTTTGSVFGGIVIVVFGIIWTAMASQMGGGPGVFGFFPLFGIVFILFGVGMSIYSFSKASDYARAERAYRRRRSALLDQKYKR
jgi:DNA-directed RNA polymerase subunit RPC12/RpoP